MVTLKNGTTIKFREVLSLHQVNVIVNNTPMKGFSEYTSAAKWAQQRYGLTDGQLMQIYRDYKEDYDSL